jgi:hypothetical protein
VLLILDVEVIEHLALLSFSQVRVVVLTVEFPLPHVDLTVFLLDQTDQVLILIYEVGVLG